MEDDVRILNVVHRALSELYFSGTHESRDRPMMAPFSERGQIKAES